MKNIVLLLFIFVTYAAAFAQYPVNRSGVSIVDGVNLPWKPNNTYNVDELVYINEKLYVANTVHVSTAVFNDDYANWTELSAGGLIPWVSGFNYNIGENVYDSLTNKIYRVNTAHLSGATFAADIANWDELSKGLDGIIASTDNAVIRWDGVSGSASQDSGMIIDDLVNVSGVNDLTVAGTTTLNTGLTGFIKAVSGVVSAQAIIDLTTDIGATILPIANGGTNSAAVLANDRVMYSQGDAIVESSVTLNAAGEMVIDGKLTVDGLVSQTGLGASTYFGFDSGIADDLSTNRNVGVGYEAMRKTTTGSSNTAVGDQALENNIVGNNNTAIGARTLQNNNQSTANNTAIGYLSSRLVSGVQNTTIGSESLENTTNFSRNTVMGYKAGTRVLGNDNVIIGSSAQSHESGGGMNRNIIIGSLTGSDSRASSDNLLIGYDLELPTTTTSNYMSIGNLLYGDFANTRVGVHTPSPTVPFEVTGDSLITGSLAVTNEHIMSYITTPTNPAVGSVKVYSKSDDSLYILDSSGNETAVGSSVVTTEGDMVIGNNLGEPIRLPIGLSNKVLKSNGTTVSWEDDVDGTTPLMVKGSIFASNGVVNGEFTACADGQRLEWDSTQAAGFKCVAAFVSPLTTQGDILVRGVAADERLAKGVDNQLFTMVAGVPQWANAPISTTLSNAGEIQTHDGTNNIAQAAPTLDGSFLVADLAQPTKMKWSDSITGLISQAMFVGDAYYPETVNCDWSNGTSAYDNFVADADCAAPVIRGQLSNPLNSQPSIKILNARTDGYYQVKAQGFFYLNAGSDAFIRLSDGVDSGGTSVINAVADSRNLPSVSHNFKFSTGGDKTVQIQAKSSSIVRVINDNVIGRRLYFSVHFFPDSTSLAAVQNKELTAATSNSGSFRVASSGIVSSEDFNFINGNCVNGSTGKYTCTYVGGLITQIPVVTPTAVISGSEGRFCSVDSSSVAQFTVGCYNTQASLNPVNSAFTVDLDKQGADVNKSQVIAGTFDKINSTDLVKIQVTKSDLQTFVSGSNDIIKYNTIINNSNPNGYFNTSTGVFTSPRDSNYLICPKVLFDTGSWGVGTRTEMVDHNSGTYDRPQMQATSNLYLHVGKCKELFLLKNESTHIKLRQDTGVDKSLILSADYNTLTITELPDTESIIKNLNDNNNIECQTKYLQANTTTVGVMSDLTYPVVIGKKYSISHSANITATVDHSILDGAIVLGRIYDTGGAIVGVHNPCFVATTTSITTIKGNAAQTNGGAGRNDTWSQLCRLPDNYICEGTP